MKFGNIWGWRYTRKQKMSIWLYYFYTVKYLEQKGVIANVKQI